MYKTDLKINSFLVQGGRVSSSSSRCLRMRIGNIIYQWCTTGLAKFLCKGPHIFGFVGHKICVVGTTQLCCCSWKYPQMKVKKEKKKSSHRQNANEFIYRNNDMKCKFHIISHVTKYCSFFIFFQPCKINPQLSGYTKTGNGQDLDHELYLLFLM